MNHFVGNAQTTRKYPKLADLAGYNILRVLWLRNRFKIHGIFLPANPFQIIDCSLRSTWGETTSLSNQNSCWKDSGQIYEEVRKFLAVL